MTGRQNRWSMRDKEFREIIYTAIKRLINNRFWKSPDHSHITKEHYCLYIFFKQRDLQAKNQDGKIQLNPESKLIEKLRR